LKALEGKEGTIFLIDNAQVPRRLIEIEIEIYVPAPPTPSPPPKQNKQINK